MSRLIFSKRLALIELASREIRINTAQHYRNTTAFLWSKPLPNGKMLKLTKISSNRLFHKSELGEFYLSSDRAIATFSSWVKMKHIIDQIPTKELEAFIRLTDTIGGIVI